MQEFLTAFPDYQMETLDLAKALLGCFLLHQTEEGTTSGRIVEVEAYIGPHDKGAHSYGGRPTPRTEVMYGPPGIAYIYQIYGLHHCFNVVSGAVGAPEAILVRALEPLDGIQLMARRRKLLPADGSETAIQPGKLKLITNGPGKLAQAMGINKLQNGFDLTASPLRIYQGPSPAAGEIASGPRIGIDYAEEARDYPWRFWIRNNPFVSK